MLLPLFCYSELIPIYSLRHRPKHYSRVPCKREARASVDLGKRLLRTAGRNWAHGMGSSGLFLEFPSKIELSEPCTLLSLAHHSELLPNQIKGHFNWKCNTFAGLLGLTTNFPLKLFSVSPSPAFDALPACSQVSCESSGSQPQYSVANSEAYGEK